MALVAISKKKKTNGQPKAVIALPVVKSGKKTASRTRRRGGTTVVRNLLRGSIPRGKFSFRSVGSVGTLHDVVEVTGTEVIGEIFATSVLFAQASVLISPANSMLFPRLSGIALPFDRYKFDSLRVDFHSAAPATRSGSVGLAVQFDPFDPDPTSLVQLGSFENSALAAISESFGTSASWPASDPWYLTTVRTDINSNVDVALRYPGKIVCMTADASTADVGSLAGYISLSYKIRLARLKPLENVVFSAIAPSITANGPGATPILSPWSVVGWFDWLTSNSNRIGSDFLKYAASVALPAGTYNALTNFSAGAPASSLKKGLADRNRKDTGTCTLSWYRNPAFHPESGGMLKKQSSDSQKFFGGRPALTLLPPDCVSQEEKVDIGAPMSFKPLAANDISVHLRSVPITNPIATAIAEIATEVENSAGSLVFQFGDTFTLTVPSYLFFTLFTPVGDERVITDQTVSFSIQSGSSG